MLARSGDLLERQPLVRAKLAQAAADADVDRLAGGGIRHVVNVLPVGQVDLSISARAARFG
jgi:hypothetical protein